MAADAIPVRRLFAVPNMPFWIAANSITTEISRILNETNRDDENDVHITNVIPSTAIATPTALQPPMRS